MATPIIHMQDLRFAYAGAAPCLGIAQFEVAPGERLFLHGESGSGKSTLLGLLAGVLAPQSGELQVLGTELSSLSAGRRDQWRGDHIGLIFQQFNLVPYLSVLDNVVLPCGFSARRRGEAGGTPATLREEAMRLLASLKLEEALWHRKATALSVGQQQRVAAARALIGRPELLIADEPTSALDAARQEAFLELLMRETQRAGSTLVFVSHDLRLAPLFSRCVALADINRAMHQAGEPSAV